MNAKEIENYLYTHIPITKALGVKAVAFSREEIKFSAPISKNINHRSTAFGGSISSLLITTGWSYVRLLFDEFETIPQIVISKSTTQFLHPILSDFTSELIIPDADTLKNFMAMYKRFGKARIRLNAQIKKAGEVLANYEGEFAVIKS
ncbi:MAG: YiiD C-terminal domain-containing protein [Balneolaceae bacterium]